MAVLQDIANIGREGGNVWRPTLKGFLELFLEGFMEIFSKELFFWFNYAQNAKNK